MSKFRIKDYFLFGSDVIPTVDKRIGLTCDNKWLWVTIWEEKEVISFTVDDPNINTTPYVCSHLVDLCGFGEGDPYYTAPIELLEFGVDSESFGLFIDSLLYAAQKSPSYEDYKDKMVLFGSDLLTEGNHDPC